MLFHFPILCIADPPLPLNHLPPTTPPCNIIAIAFTTMIWIYKCEVGNFKNYKVFIKGDNGGKIFIVIFFWNELMGESLM